MTHTISASRLDELLGRASAQRVLVIGDVMLDVYLIGDVDRISPEAPVPVVRVRERRQAPGGAANVAQNVSALGAQCELVAAIGRDHAGAALRSRLEMVGVRANRLVEIDRCTTEKTRVVARSQQVVRVDVEEDGDLAASERQRVLDQVHDALPEASAIILEDYNKGVLTADVIETIMRWAQARAVPVVVDPKYRNFFQYGGATIFKPNRRELESAMGAAIDLEHEPALPELVDRLNVQNILLTMGERGMVLFGRTGNVVRIPTVARTVFDVVGAGDTVSAFLATMLAAGASPEEAAIIANWAAGIEVGKLGAATVTADELRDYAQGHHSNSRPI